MFFLSDIDGKFFGVEFVLIFVDAKSFGNADEGIEWGYISNGSFGHIYFSPPKKPLIISVEINRL
jgi:hypothetical protein